MAEVNMELGVVAKVKDCDSCERCAILHAKLERIREILSGGRAGKGRAPGYLTEAGKLIAAAAASRNMKLAEVSDRIGRAPDYVARVCRGDIKLVRSAALAIGAALDIGLMGFVGEEGRRRPTGTQEPIPFGAQVGTDGAR